MPWPNLPLDPLPVPGTGTPTSVDLTAAANQAAQWATLAARANSEATHAAICGYAALELGDPPTALAALHLSSVAAGTAAGYARQIGDLLAQAVAAVAYQGGDPPPVATLARTAADAAAFTASATGLVRRLAAQIATHAQRRESPCAVVD